MDSVVQYFSSIPSTHRTLFMVSGIAFFWMLETAKPLYSMRYRKWHHATLNLFFTGTTIVVNFALAFLLVHASNWAADQSFGILNWLPNIPILGQVLLGLLMLDLIGAYFAHWLEHQVKWMWRFHLIHHTDLHVDTTTANRHHPGESVIRFVFTTVAVLVSGAPMWLVLLYQTLSVALSQFNHANIGLSKSVDGIVSWIIVTPNMHHLHHHWQQPYTDRNYGNIFAIWDRLFGTFTSAGISDLKYGIDTYPEPSENSNLGMLLTIPFREYRDPPGSKFSRRNNTTEPT